MQTTALKNRKLVSATSLKEAEKILDAKNIGKTDAIRKLVGLAFKMTDDSDKKHTLQEADDSAMGKEGPAPEQSGQKNAQEQSQNSEARENSGEESQLHGNPGKGTGSDVPTPETSSEKDQQNAKEQTGDSQLGGANKENMPLYQMMGQEPSPDMLNQKMIELMDPQNGPGLSKVAAGNQAAQQGRDQMGFLQEAMKPVLTHLDGKLRKLEADNFNLQEALNILKTSGEKGKIALMRTGGPGGNPKNQEAMLPGSDPTVEESVNQLEIIETDSLAKEDFQRDILLQY